MPLGCLRSAGRPPARLAALCARRATHCRQPSTTRASPAFQSPRAALTQSTPFRSPGAVPAPAPPPPPPAGDDFGFATADGAPPPRGLEARRLAALRRAPLTRLAVRAPFLGSADAAAAPPQPRFDGEAAAAPEAAQEAPAAPAAAAEAHGADPFAAPSAEDAPSGHDAAPPAPEPPFVAAPAEAAHDAAPAPPAPQLALVPAPPTALRRAPSSQSPRHALAHVTCPALCLARSLWEKSNKAALKKKAETEANEKRNVVEEAEAERTLFHSQRAKKVEAAKASNRAAKAAKAAPADKSGGGGGNVWEKALQLCEGAKPKADLGKMKALLTKLKHTPPLQPVALH